jgi:hypothetical protein
MMLLRAGRSTVAFHDERQWEYVMSESFDDLLWFLSEVRLALTSAASSLSRAEAMLREDIAADVCLDDTANHAREGKSLMFDATLESMTAALALAQVTGAELPTLPIGTKVH